MSAIGSGVLKDAAAIPLRFTYYDPAHADTQVDQLGNFAYDLHKIWACMGRNGANGIMRTGFIEEGDPFNGWAAGTIEEVVGGVPVAVQRWDSLVGYNPLGGLTTGDYCLFGALAPFDGFLLHLDAGLGAQPPFTAEYWTGAAWAGLTLTTTPDFTCAGGILNQRGKWTLPSNWASVNAAGLALALANPGTYYYMRLKLGANIGAGPLANQLYKDFLQGHIKHFYCHYGLKRGDDSTGTLAPDFSHDGDVIIRFRDGFSLEGRTNLGGVHNWGSVVTSPAPNRPTIASGGTVICSSGKGPVVFGGLFAGVMIMSKPRHSSYNSLMALRGNVTPLDLIGVQIMGPGATGGTPFGGAGSTVIRRISDVRYCIHPLYDQAANYGLCNPYAVSQAQDGFVERFVLDVRNSAAINYALRTSVAGPVKMSGVVLTDDAAIIGGGSSSGQIVQVGGGDLSLFDIQWGGPNNKVGLSGRAFEWRRVRFWVHLDGTTTPLAGIPVRIRLGDGSIYQEVTTDVDGTALWTGGSGFGIGYHQFPASTWDSAIDPNLETLEDEPIAIEVNPSDMVGYNPTYATLVYKGRFGRAKIYDPTLGDMTDRDWQRVEWVGILALPLASSGPVGVTVITAPDIPLEADGVQRIDVILPEAT